jgi:hypothetical protein
VLLFDLEIHWCRGYDVYSHTTIQNYNERMHTLKRAAMRQMVRLKRLYVVTGREMSRSANVK